MWAKRLFARRRSTQDMRRKILVCGEEVVTAVVVGSSGGGKSGLVDRLTGSQGLVDTGQGTVLQAGSTHFDHHGLKVRVHLRDTSGREDMDRLRRQSYLFANAVILVFDTAKRDVFEDMEKTWVPEIRRYGDDVPVVLVGTKLPVPQHADAVKATTTTPEATSHVTWDLIHDVMEHSRERRESDCDSGRHSFFEMEQAKNFYIASDSDAESLCNKEKGCEVDRLRRNSSRDQGCRCNGACNCVYSSGHSSHDEGYSSCHGNGCVDKLFGKEVSSCTDSCETRLGERLCYSLCETRLGERLGDSLQNKVSHCTQATFVKQTADDNCCLGDTTINKTQDNSLTGSRSDLLSPSLLPFIVSETASNGNCRCGRERDLGKLDLRKAALGLGGRRGSLKEIFLRQKSSPAAITRALDDRRGSDTFLVHQTRAEGGSSSLRPSSICPKCDLPRNKTVLSHISRKWNSFRLPSRHRLSSHDGDSGVDTDSESSHSRESDRRRGSKSFLGRLLERRGSSSRGSDVTPSTPEMVSTEDLHMLSQRSVSEAEGHAMAVKIGAATYFECSLTSGFDPCAILSVVVNEHFKARKAKIGILCKLKRAMSA